MCTLIYELRYPEEYTVIDIDGVNTGARNGIQLRSRGTIFRTYQLRQSDNIAKHDVEINVFFPKHRVTFFAKTSNFEWRYCLLDAEELGISSARRHQSPVVTGFCQTDDSRFSGGCESLGHVIIAFGRGHSL